MTKSGLKNIKLTNESRAILYKWVDSKVNNPNKRNIARDFSDGYFIATIIDKEHPGLVQMHSYDRSCSIKRKRDSWTLLNREVLPKLSIHLTDIDINALANSNLVTIESLLYKIKVSLENYKGSNLIQKNHSAVAEEKKSVEPKFCSELYSAIDKIVTDLSLPWEQCKALSDAAGRVPRYGINRLVVVLISILESRTFEEKALGSFLRVLKNYFIPNDGYNEVPCVRDEQLSSRTERDQYDNSDLSSFLITEGLVTESVNMVDNHYQSGNETKIKKVKLNNKKKKQQGYFIQLSKQLSESGNSNLRSNISAKSENIKNNNSLIKDLGNISESNQVDNVTKDHIGYRVKSNDNISQKSAHECYDYRQDKYEHQVPQVEFNKKDKEELTYMVSDPRSDKNFNLDTCLDSKSGMNKYNKNTEYSRDAIRFKNSNMKSNESKYDSQNNYEKANSTLDSVPYNINSKGNLDYNAYKYITNESHSKGSHSRNNITNKNNIYQYNKGSERNYEKKFNSNFDESYNNRLCYGNIVDNGKVKNQSTIRLCMTKNCCNADSKYIVKQVNNGYCRDEEGFEKPTRTIERDLPSPVDRMHVDKYYKRYIDNKRVNNDLYMSISRSDESCQSGEELNRSELDNNKYIKKAYNKKIYLNKNNLKNDRNLKRSPIALTYLDMRSKEKSLDYEFENAIINLKSNSDDHIINKHMLYKPKEINDFDYDITKSNSNDTIISKTEQKITNYKPNKIMKEKISGLSEKKKNSFDIENSSKNNIFVSQGKCKHRYRKEERLTSKKDRLAVVNYSDNYESDSSIYYRNGNKKYNQLQNRRNTKYKIDEKPVYSSSSQDYSRKSPSNSISDDVQYKYIRKKGFSHIISNANYECDEKGSRIQDSFERNLNKQYDISPEKLYLITEDKSKYNQRFYKNEYLEEESDISNIDLHYNKNTGSSNEYKIVKHNSLKHLSNIVNSNSSDWKYEEDENMDKVEFYNNHVNNNQRIQKKNTNTEKTYCRNLPSQKKIRIQNKYSPNNIDDGYSKLEYKYNSDSNSNYKIENSNINLNRRDSNVLKSRQYSSKINITNQKERYKNKQREVTKNIDSIQSSRTSINETDMRQMLYASEEASSIEETSEYSDYDDAGTENVTAQYVDDIESVKGICSRLSKISGRSLNRIKREGGMHVAKLAAHFQEIGNVPIQYENQNIFFNEKTTFADSSNSKLKSTYLVNSIIKQLSSRI